ncbi:hypothetical protein IFR05_017103, partial [Cadophora sp. M221]
MASLRKTQNMPNDNATIRLLYAILSQKCLKDIDWPAVANNPILNQEITNGHAARMRYARFKKQMDAANGIIAAPSTPRKPRKNNNRVEKTRSPKRAGGGESKSGVKIEGEREGREGKGKGKERERDRGVKREYGVREGTGESIFSNSASTNGSLMDDRDRDLETPDLEGGLMHRPSPAVSLAQHDLSSGLGIGLNYGHDHGYAHNLGAEQAGQLNFQHAAVQIKRERKPSAHTLHSGLYGNSHHTAPLRAPHQLPGGGGGMLDFHKQNQNQHQQVTSSVSNSTLPSTPRMCIEELENEDGHQHFYKHSPSNHSPHSYSQYYRHGHAENENEQDSFGLASSDLGMDVDVDGFMHSFGMVGDHGHSHAHPHSQGQENGNDMYSPLMSDGGFAFGMGSPGLGLSGIGGGGGVGYDDFWNHHDH